MKNLTDIKITKDQFIEMVKGKILEKSPKAKDFSFGHNNYVWGVFYDNTAHGGWNHEFESVIVGESYLFASDFNLL